MELDSPSHPPTFLLIRYGQQVQIHRYTIPVSF
jgi:hypothetical protein